MPRISFVSTYLQALSHKDGLEYDVLPSRLMHKLDQITFATITPTVQILRANERFCLYRVDMFIHRRTKVTMELQKTILKYVLNRVQQFAGSSRINSIVFSANPDDVHDFCIMLKFILLDQDVPPPNHIVEQHIRECLSKMTCVKIVREKSIPIDTPNHEDTDWKYEI